MSVVLHRVNNASEWPPYIAEFSQFICRPLPLTFMPHVGTPANFEEFATAADTVPTSQTERGLLSLSSIIAWTVRDLQHPSRRKAIDNGPHSTLFPVYNLIKALAHLLGPTLEIAADVSFVTPQSSDKFEGVAFAVVSHVVSKEDRPRVQTDECVAQSDDIPEDTSIDVEEEEHEEVVNRWELDTEARDAYDANHPLWDTADREAQPVNRRYEIYGPFFHIYEGDDWESETESSIDLPLEAHVEVVSGPRTRAALPVVFAADWDNILLLCSSVLYQRQVWGIDLPAVGVCVDKDSPIVRLCVSWFDSGTNSLNQAELPRVHTALAAEELADTSVGVFDLSSMSGALSFARAILELQDQCQVIAAASKDNATTSSQWRSDNISATEVTREERVSQWLQDVSSEETQEIVDSSTAAYPQENPTPANSDELPREGRPVPTPSIASHPSSGLYTGKCSHLGGKASPPTAPPGSQFPSSPSARKPESDRINTADSVPSHAELAETKSLSITDETMAAFLFDRNVCFLSLHGCDDVSASAMKNPSIAKDTITFRAMVAQYKHLTRFGWPSTWALEPHKSIPSTHFLDDERETLCRQYEALPEDVKKSALEPEVYDVLRDHLLFVLLASIGQHIRDAKLAKLRTVNEAEARHDWDGLLFHMYVSGTERISPNILLEHRLQTCRNRHFDISVEDRDNWSQKVYTYSWMHYTLCLSELRQATDGITPGDPGVVYPPEAPPTRAVQAYLRAVWETNTARLNHSLIAVNTRPADSKLDVLLKLLEKRVAKEPALGICDAIAISSISRKDVDDEVVAKYRNFMQPVYNEHLRHPDEGQKLIIGFKTCTSDAGYNQGADADRKASEREPPPKIPKIGSNVLKEFPADLDQTLTDALRNKLRVRKDLPVEEQQPFDLDSSSTHGLTAATPDVSRCTDQPPEGKETPHVDDLWVPVIFSEYKKRDDATSLKAVGQARSYICSGVDFMGSVGIYDHPVLSLITNGSRGAVIMGWKSSHSRNVYILERDICIFDISVPIQAYHFAIFLIRLRIWAKEQQESLKEKVIAHFKNTPVDQLQKWTKEAQALQHFELHHPSSSSV